MTTRCLSTRRTPEGFKRRRYERDDGVRFSTVEVPLQVWSGVCGHGRTAERAQAWLRARERDAVRQRALGHMAAGWKAIASAHALGVPVRTVQRWRAEHAGA